MIHVCFSLYDKTGHYSKFTGTAMLSLFENTSSEVTVHIFHDNTLINDNRAKFVELTNRYGQVIKFYNVEELCADRIAKIRKYFSQSDMIHLTVGAFYRLCIAHILPDKIEKAIYLDSDIIVNLDINELWQIELADHPLAAVLEADNNSPISNWSIMCRNGVVKEEDYFNSGVCLINLEVFRKEEDNILTGIKFVTKHYNKNLADQDVLNYCFANSILRLPVKFNRLIKESRNCGVFSITKEIYHYAGGDDGLGFNISDPFDRLWWSYFIRTQWFDVNTLGNILKGATNSMLQANAVSLGKIRVFIVDEAHAYQIERNFLVRDEEEVIIVDTEREENFQRLIDLMNGEKGRKIFFVGIPKVSELQRIGFAEGKDFFDVSALYSPICSGRTNNYKFILSM